MEELPGGLRRVTMPLPTRPGHVHCYLLPVDDGFMLVDTGLGLPDAARAVGGRARRARRARSSTIFLTHFHPDHLGAAADVHELTGARVVQGRLDAEQAALAWAERRLVGAVLAEWFQRNGVPEAVTEELIGQGVLLSAVHQAGRRPRARRRRRPSCTAGRSSPLRGTPTAS